MNIEQLTFGIKDVFIIISAVLSIVGFIFAIRKTAENAKDKIDALDKVRKTDKAELAQKINTETKDRESDYLKIAELIQDHKRETEKREKLIYDRISDVREEHRDTNEKLSVKMDSMAIMMNNLSSKISELTGYIKGKTDKDKE